ncbi:MAG: ABC1 kinase family protein [Dehalococcoidia bacterium]
MGKSFTGAKPLPLASRARRFTVVSWNFAVIYLRYKRVQRNTKLSRAEKEARYAREHERNARRLYNTAARMQGLLIKACQFISSRADVAPPEYVAILGHLQDRVPARPYEAIAAQIERELGERPEVLFREFSRAPVAAASLAQVHRATTHDGRDVAVKVQYPDIERVVETDLRNMSFLVRLLARIEPNFDYRVLFDEYAKYTPKELDFHREGRSGERVAKDLAHRKDVRVPAIDWRHTARRVLTTEFIEGVKISNIPGMAAMGVDPNAVAQIMTEAYCEQILVHGFFHADPHPGNLLVQPGPVVVFIDFGLSKDLPAEFRMNYARLTVAIMRQDDDSMAAGFRAIGFETKSNDPESLVALGRAFFDSAGPGAKPYVDAEVMPEVNERLARMLKENPVTRIPADILLIFRVLGLMSGLQKRLDSRVSMADTIMPYAESQAAS